MKILLVGKWLHDFHEDACANALEELGHKVESFKWFKYFDFSNPRKTSLLKRTGSRLQHSFAIGPTVDKINKDLLETAKKTKPDLVFIYRGTHIKKKTIEKIKKLDKKMLVAGYCNDDPFSKKAPYRFWWRFRESIPVFDANFVYREKNVKDFLRAGAKNAFVLKPWFAPSLHKPVRLSKEERKEFRSDVVFIGHFENDGRKECLEEIAKRGIKLTLFGEHWNNAAKSSKYLKRFYPVKPIWGNDYNKALCASKIALCFLSKINNDVYTRRCFEIPATKTFLLSEFTEELNSMLEEGKEAEYFRNKEEMMEKIRYYLEHEKERKRIAENGYKRVMRDKHDVKSRMRYVIKTIEELEQNGRI